MMARKAPAARIAFVAAFLALVLVPVAVAGKPGGGGGGHNTAGGGSLSLVLLDSTDGVAHDGQRLTFNVATTATDRPFVGLRCWQGATWVYDGYVGYFPTYLFDQWFILGSSYWDPATTANCTARLFYYNRRGGENLLATTTFVAYP